MIFCVVPYDISYSTGILEMLNLEDTFDPNFHYSLFWGDCKHPSVKTTVVYTVAEYLIIWRAMAAVS